MRISNKLVIATTNRGKFEEFCALLKAYPEIEPIPIEQIARNASSLGHVESHTQDATYFSNAAAKARLANACTHYPVLADDSGLEVMTLEGRPGIRSHKYAAPKPKLSQEQANIEQILMEVSGKPRDARMVCTLVLMIEGMMIDATGTVEGVLSEIPTGENGFGYDSIFIPKSPNNDMGLTFAEMADSEKNALSHRAKALQALMEKVKSHSITLAKP